MAPDRSQQLYDLATDPKEQTNVAMSQVTRLLIMKNFIRNRTAFAVPRGKGSPMRRELDEEQRDRLRALGYAE